MKASNLLFLLWLSLCSQWSVATTVDSGYESAKDVSGTCSTNANDNDRWGFSACNCTSYVAYKINEATEYHSGSNPMFCNSFANIGNPKTSGWHNAYQWRDAVNDRAPGIVNRYPLTQAEWESALARGMTIVNAVAIAWWNQDDPNDKNDKGHVAWVEKIHDDGKIVDVSEYNWNEKFGYGTRTLAPSDSGYPDQFLYIYTDDFQECDLTGLCSPQCTGTGGQGGGGNPNQVNLKIDFDILDVDGNELYAKRDTLGPMLVKLRVQVVAEHDDAGNWAKSGREKISIDYFARYDGGDWAKVGSGEMTIGKLDEGRMIQETLVYGIPNVATTRVEFKASIDTDHEIDESDEGDNTSRVESYAYDVNAINLYRPDMTMAGLSLTGGRTQLTQGDRFGLEALPKNVGGRKAVASRMAYYLQAPGGGLNYVMDDGVDELSPGQDSYELTRNEPFTANAGGWWHAYAYADYQGNVTESNEGNNGLDYWFYVVPAMPDLVVEALWLREGGSFKKDTRVHPYYVVRNIGNGTAGPSRLAYYIDADRFRDGDDVDSLCPGCSGTENVKNDNIRLGDTGNRTYRCCVDAWGSVAESNEGNNCATIGFTVKKK